MIPPFEKNEQGLTLLELLTAMALTMVVLTAVCNTFIAQQRTYHTQEQVNEMIQTARASLDIISREVKMAGYDPSGTGIIGIPYNAGQLKIVADLNGDGDTNDDFEYITYNLDTSLNKIIKNTSGWSQTFADHIDSFQVNYLDKNGNATTDSNDIRKLNIQIVVKTAGQDRYFYDNGGYRTCRMSAVITPPNLSI